MFTAKWQTYQSPLQTYCCCPTDDMNRAFTLLPIIFLLLETIIMRTSTLSLYGSILSKF
jgi:hypothetical protein